MDHLSRSDLDAPSRVVYSSPRYWPQLDGLRTLAVFAVLGVHGSYGVLRGGFLGVDLFFVLSGFLITSLLASEMERFGKIRFGFFYFRRFLRLYPPLVLMVFLTAFIWKDLPGHSSFGRVALGALFYHANFVADNRLLEHTWSLSMEEQFYFVWPFVMSWLLSLRWRRWSPAILIFFIAVAVAVRYTMIYGFHVDPPTVYPFPFARMDSLICGALGALMIRMPRVVEIVRRPTPLKVIGWTCLGAFLVMTCVTRVEAVYTWGFTAVAFFFLVWILCLVLLDSGDGGLNRLLSSRPMVYLGKRSYGIYLYHYGAFAVLERFRTQHSMGNFALISVLRIVLAVLIAIVSYRFIESPILALKDKFAVLKRDVPAEKETLVKLA